MALAPRLDLRQTQSLVMTPQLQQAIKLLALSNLEIEGFIGEALEANPLLDLGEPQATPDTTGPDATGDVAGERTTTLENSPVDSLIREGHAEEDRPLDIDPAATGDEPVAAAGDEPERDWRHEAGGGEMASGEPRAGRDIDEWSSGAPTLVEHIKAQLGQMVADGPTRVLASLLAALLDDAGYLTQPLAEIAADLGVGADALGPALALLQACDPCGVGARDLAECIALQARDADRYDPAMAQLIDHLEWVARGDWARLRRICEVDEEDLSQMLAELRGYDPKPGLRIGGEVAAAVIPDILLSPRADAGWDLVLNPATLPRLVVNRPYYTELRGACGDKAARGWLSEKLADATWLIKALDQRQRTILSVTGEIVRRQDGFFRRGVSHLRPLTLKTVAEAVGVHESTVSRVTANKYLGCRRGTFELKYFFTSGVAAADGDGSVSAEAVKAAIRQLIDGESADAVLSDDALVDLLRARGFDCARRTVAKYREAIGLGSSVQRRRAKALAAMR